MSTHNMFLLRNKKNIMWIPPLICSYAGFILSKTEKQNNLLIDVYGILSQICIHM